MKTKPSTRTVGIDLGIEWNEMDRSAATCPEGVRPGGASNRKHAACVLDAKGGIITEQSIANTREALAQLSAKHPGALVVMEVGMNSPWI